MRYITAVRTRNDCRDCSDITEVRFNDRIVLESELVYYLAQGERLTCGSFDGPEISPVRKGDTRYVRTAVHDTSDDELLKLPRF